MEKKIATASSNADRYLFGVRRIHAIRTAAFDVLTPVAKWNTTLLRVGGVRSTFCITDTGAEHIKNYEN